MIFSQDFGQFRSQIAVRPTDAPTVHPLGQVDRAGPQPASAARCNAYPPNQLQGSDRSDQHITLKAYTSGQRFSVAIKRTAFCSTAIATEPASSHCPLQRCKPTAPQGKGGRQTEPLACRRLGRYLRALMGHQGRATWRAAAVAAGYRCSHHVSCQGAPVSLGRPGLPLVTAPGAGGRKGVPPGTLRFFTVGMAILGRFRPIFGPGGLGLADMAC